MIKAKKIVENAGIQPAIRKRVYPPELQWEPGLTESTGHGVPPYYCIVITLKIQKLRKALPSISKINEFVHIITFANKIKSYFVLELDVFIAEFSCLCYPVIFTFRKTL